MKNILILFLLLSLAGCISVSSSPSSRFYALESAKEPGAALAGANSLSNVVIGIGPVTLPEYLNRPQIVTKNKNNTVEFAQFDRWTDTLDQEIIRVMAKNFSLFLPQANTQIYPWNSIIPVKYQVIMEVIQLDCKLDGDADMLVQWSVIGAQEKKMLLTKRSEYRQSLETHDYPGLVQALSLISESLGREIAQALTQLPAQVKP